MAAGSAVSSDTELDFEFSPEGGETTGGGMGSEQDAMAGVSEQPAPSDLAESIKVLVREQTAHALREINVNSRHGGCTSRGESRVGGDILEPYDPQDKDQNVDRWLAKIDQMGAIHHWSEYERSCYMQAKLHRWLAKIDQMGAIHHWSEYERSCYMQAKLRGAKRTWF
ncbi:hypothetical protein QE152_g30573 [Popillia japonica]|uniref:Uncharacterized protein n=1 Tax=Popillia japonica TaxID=7064 RepID=A0AAW1JFE6_POPJA